MGGAEVPSANAWPAHGVVVPVVNLGLPDRFVEQGEREELLAACGLDAAGIQRTVERARPSTLRGLPGVA